VADFNSTGSDRWDNYYRDGIGGFTRQATQSTLPLNLYDDGTGVLATVGSNNYAVYWFYLGPSDAVVMVYGTGSYNKLSDAQASTPPLSLPLRLQTGSLLLGRFITTRSGGTSTVVLTETAFGTTFSSGVAVNHNDLAGLQGGAIGDYNHLTTAEVAKLNQFTSVTPGIVPLSGGGTTNFLRADGIWTTAVVASTAPLYETAVASAAQTVFNTTLSTVANSGGKNFLMVTSNGAVMDEGAGNDYTVTGATQVTFTSGRALNTKVTFRRFS
jgi:hypothetical protein